MIHDVCVDEVLLAFGGGQVARGVLLCLVTTGVQHLQVHRRRLLLRLSASLLILNDVLQGGEGLVADLQSDFSDILKSELEQRGVDFGRPLVGVGIVGVLPVIVVVVVLDGENS